MKPIDVMCLLTWISTMVIGFGMLISGNHIGLIVIFMSMLSGYFGITALIKEFSSK